MALVYIRMCLADVKKKGTQLIVTAVLTNDLLLRDESKLSNLCPACKGSKSDGFACA